MKKLLKILPFVAMHLATTIGIWTTIVNLYIDIMRPETLTRFEMFLAFLVSINMADALFSKVLRTRLAKEVKDYIDDGWDTK